MDVGRALGDGVRRRILLDLRAGPRSVTELAERFTISRPAISRHLRVLLESGLVQVEPQGRERHYRLDPAPLLQLERWLAQFHHPLEHHLDALATEVARTRRQRRHASDRPAERPTARDHPVGHRAATEETA
jgi:DNA-binding transcriptional ArsR family regulator